MKRALIAMSGGVDSSVAALLTTKEGYECVGCTMRLHDNVNEDAGEDTTCGSLRDAEDAKKVAEKLGMNFEILDFSDNFRELVIQKFIDSYLSARTPNPCVDCNRTMKFDKLYQHAVKLGCDKIVTGHYAQIGFENGKYVLKKAVDDTKDQSYVLYNLTQELLAHVLFPLGGMTKTEARKIADENGFVNADKPESQDICFVPDGDYAKIIERYTCGECGGCRPAALEPGNFVALEDGKVLGQHKGLIHYTIGQRRGLGIAAPAPLYVVKLSPEDNTVILGSNDDLFKKEAFINDINWISGEAPTEEITLKAKIRYRQKEQPAHLIPVGDGSCAKLLFDEPQRAITPGQAAVFYDGDVVLGGGTIV